MAEKVTVTKIAKPLTICDDKVEKCGFSCFKTSGANGVLDIFGESINVYTFVIFKP
jgi:hypothetical protein